MVFVLVAAWMLFPETVALTITKKVRSIVFVRPLSDIFFVHCLRRRCLVIMCCGMYPSVSRIFLARVYFYQRALSLAFSSCWRLWTSFLAAYLPGSLSYALDCKWYFFRLLCDRADSEALLHERETTFYLFSFVPPCQRISHYRYRQCPLSACLDACLWLKRVLLFLAVDFSMDFYSTCRFPPTTPPVFIGIDDVAKRNHKTLACFSVEMPGAWLSRRSECFLVFTS